MGDNYGKLWDRDFFEFGKTDYSKTAIKIMQWNVSLDKNIGIWLTRLILNNPNLIQLSIANNKQIKGSLFQH